MYPVTLLLASLVCQADLNDRELINYIKVASKANIEGFTHGRVEFEILRSHKTGSGGLKDRQLEDATRGNGLLLFNSPNALLRIDYNDEEVIKGTKVVGVNQQTSESTPISLLTDGDSTLMSILALDPEKGVLEDSPEVYPDKGNDFFRGFAKFVYPVGNNRIINDKFATDAQEVANGDAELEQVRVEEVPAEGKIARLSIAKKNGVRREYVVNLDKGAIPLETRDYGPGGKLMSEVLIGELKKFPGAGWFPCVKRLNKPAAKVSVLYVATRIDFVAKPAESEFVVRFRAPVSFTDRVTSTFQKSATEYSLIERKKKLPKNSVKVELKESPVLAASGVMPGELAAPSYRPYVMVVGAVCVLAGFAAWRISRKAK